MVHDKVHSSSPVEHRITYLINTLEDIYDQKTLNPTSIKVTYNGFPVGLDKRDCNPSSRVPKIVIFLRTAEAWRCVSGPDEGKEPLPEIMPLIPSAIFIASLYSFIHVSEGDAIKTLNNNINQINRLILKDLMSNNNKELKINTIESSLILWKKNR